MWDTLSHHFPDLLPLLRLMYGEDGLVFFKSGDETTTIRNNIGSRQGCAFGSFLYCLALQPLLLQLQEEFPDILVVSYCDDVNLVGNASRVIAAYKRLGQLLNVKLQSEIRPDKTVVWSPSLSVQELQVLHGLPSDVTKVTADGVRVLGVPIGTTEYKVKFAEARVAALAKDLSVIAQMPSLQCQFVLVNKSIQHSITHLLRGIDGGSAEFSDVATQYDGLMLDCVRRWCPFNELTDHSRLLSFLPLRHGGLGLRSWNLTCDAATVAGWVHCSSVLPAYYSWTKESFPSLLGGSPTAPAAPRPEHARRAIAAYRRLYAAAPNARATLVSSEERGTARHIQHAMVEHVCEAKHTEVLQLLADTEDRQHRRHTAQHLSNRADVYSLQCLPYDEWTRCSNSIFKIICARRILAKIIIQPSGLDNCTQTTSPTDDELICPITHKTSDEGVDAYGDHSLTVDVSNARTKLWHDRIRDCWLMLIRMSGWTASRETTNLLPGSSK